MKTRVGRFPSPPLPKGLFPRLTTERINLKEKKSFSDDFIVSFFFFLFFPAILMNRYDQLVARRRINVKKGNRCSCVKSSECTCINKNDETNTRYKHVKMKDYHVAHLEEKKLSPKVPEEPKVSPTIWPGVMTISWPNVMTIVCSVSTILLLFLLLLGNLEINLGFFFFFEKRGLKEEFFY